MCLEIGIEWYRGGKGHMAKTAQSRATGRNTVQLSISPLSALLWLGWKYYDQKAPVHYKSEGGVTKQ